MSHRILDSAQFDDMLSSQSDYKFIKRSDGPTLMKGSDVQVHMSWACHGPGLNSHLTRSCSFRLYASPDFPHFWVCLDINFIPFPLYEENVSDLQQLGPPKCSALTVTLAFFSPPPSP